MPDTAAIAKRLAASLSGRAAESPRDERFAISHEELFAAVFNRGIGTYYTRFDEALRKNYEDAIAMRNDASVHELVRHRQHPVLSLPHHVEADDPRDPRQKEACRVMQRIVDATPKFQDLKLALSEAIFWGKAGSNVRHGRTRVDGRPRVACVGHQPVHGDKVVFGFDGTPGVMVNQLAVEGLQARGAETFRSDRATCLKLTPGYWRDQFVIHGFEPSDAEFLFEGDKAGAVHGLGIRDRIYWIWWMRQEVLGWCLNALQRIGANGNFIGYYDQGNDASKRAVLDALKAYSEHGTTAFPRGIGAAGSNAAFDHIPPSAIAYEVMMRVVEYLDGIIRRAIVGQEMTGQSAPAGMGSGLAEVQQDTFQHIIRYDAQNLAETLTRDFLAPLARMNLGPLDFQLRLVLEIERDDFEKKLQAAQTLTAMGASIDLAELIKDAGLKPASDPNQAARAVEGKDGQPEPGKAPAAKGPEGADGEKMGRDGSPERYAAEHAPTGGIEIAGKRYSGGEWIPASVAARATPEQRRSLEGPGESDPYADLKPAYAAAEPKLLADPRVLAELASANAVSNRTLREVTGLAEGPSNFVQRTFNKAHGGSPEVAARIHAEEVARRESESKDDFLYHVTTRKNLRKIKAQGLHPGKAPTFSNYGDYSKGKLFLSEKGGVGFWKERIEDHDRHNGGPGDLVVVRVPKSKVSGLSDDELGSKDARHPSYTIDRPIPSGDIEVVGPPRKPGKGPERHAAEGRTDRYAADRPGEFAPGGGRVPAKASSLPLPEFARRVVGAAEASPGGNYGPHKTFISRARAHLERTDPDFRGMPDADFRARLLEAHAARHLELGRGDLVEHMDPADVRESRTPHLAAEYHFVRHPAAKPWPIPPGLDAPAPTTPGAADAPLGEPATHALAHLREMAERAPRMDPEAVRRHVRSVSALPAADRDEVHRRLVGGEAPGGKAAWVEAIHAHLMGAARMASEGSPERYEADRGGEFKEGGGRVPAGPGGDLAYHGTFADFDDFAKTSDLGYHFGTREQAKFRVGNQGRVIAAKLDIRNPLEAPDHAWDTPATMLAFLESRGMASGELRDAVSSWEHDSAALAGLSDDLDMKTYRKAKRELGDRKAEAKARAFAAAKAEIERAGHDGIRYENQVEGKGTSWIAFHPHQIDQQHHLHERMGRDDSPERYAARPDDGGDPGVMVALMVPAALASELAVPGGTPPAEMHVTLAYLGKLSEVGADRVAALREAVESAARTSPPLSGSIGGVGRFPASKSSDGMGVLYAGVDVPGLAELRQAVVGVLGAEGFAHRNDHGFTPHVTLDYVNADAPPDLGLLESRPVEFASVALVIGDAAETFPLGDPDPDGSPERYEADRGGEFKEGGGRVAASREGSTGAVERRGDHFFKNATNKLGHPTLEGKVYATMAGAPGIARGEAEGDKVKVPAYRHVLSRDDVPAGRRASLAPIVGRNEARVNRAISALSSAGFAYNDDLQFGVGDGQSLDLLDFSAASREGEMEALDANLGHLRSFYREFGRPDLADAVADGHALMLGATDPDHVAFADDDLREAAGKVREGLRGEPREVYYATNAREVGIPGAVSTGIIGGRRYVVSDRPVDPRKVAEWELHPLIVLPAKGPHA